MMPSTTRLIFLLIFIYGCAKHSQSVTLNDDMIKLLQEVIDDFNDSPTDAKFDSVIMLATGKSSLIPKVFIWCPIQHYNIPIVCPVHKTPFFVSPVAKASKANIRMVYDIGGNMIIVQSVYRCPKAVGNVKVHKYLSAAPEIMEILPATVALKLPLFLHHKSGFSNNLLDYLIVHICQGQCMQEIAEGIASLNFRENVRRKAVSSRGFVPKEFHENELYSFPTNDKLMHVFLWYFQQKKSSYEAHMNSLSATTLVCDCSFTLGRKILFKGPNGGVDIAEMTLDNMFIGLNEHGQIIKWNIGKQITFEDKLEILKQLKDRLERSNNEVTTILDQNCCQSRSKYNEIFPDVQIKMGIVHALKRVMKYMPKEHPDTQAFIHKFAQIFNGDSINDVRSEHTPSPVVIEANLNMFLSNLKGTLTEELVQVMDELRMHIRRGCLSGIPAGEGTEKIDNLHRYIQKSYLSHLTVITPDMAMAVLACIFYTWNCKKSIQKLYKGKGHKPLPIVPIEDYEVTTNTKKDAKDGKPEDSKHQPLIIQSSPSAAGNSPVLVITSEVINYMISRLMHIQELITTFKAKLQDKAFDVTTFPIISPHRSYAFDETAEPDSPEKLKHAKTLQGNLADFGLELDKVPGDGNCLFGSVILQVNKLAQSNPDVAKHLKSIGLGRSLEEDVARLRDLCVQELETNLSTYKEWIGMSDEDLKKELEKLKVDGFFASDIGDLCIKVCVNLLQVPVIVVTSLPHSPYYPFLPIKFTTAHPVYVAFDHTPPGHYDGTKEKIFLAPLSAKATRCSCGKNAGQTPVCAVINGQSKCPCAKAGALCQPFCRCSDRRCHNKPKPDEISCACGLITSVMKKGYVACNKAGTRARCKCVKAGIPCTAKCTCGNCGNDKPIDETKVTENTDEDVSSVESGSPKKKRRKRSSFALGAWGLESPKKEVPVTSDQWTDQEIICIMVCREVLEGCKVESNIQNISQIYRYLANSPNLEKLGVSIGMKDDTQILSKLLALQTGANIIIPEPTIAMQ